MIKYMIQIVASHFRFRKRIRLTYDEVFLEQVKFLLFKKTLNEYCVSLLNKRKNNSIGWEIIWS
jgi:hypothetical protein